MQDSMQDQDPAPSATPQPLVCPDAIQQHPWEGDTHTPVLAMTHYMNLRLKSIRCLGRRQLGDTRLVLQTTTEIA